jgi:dTDP-4-dehydrorhamnose reductase
MSMKDSEILIVGAYGQLGKALVARFPGAKAVDREQLDITDSLALAAYDWTGIRYLLNAAAYTNVDGAETLAGRKAAWLINAEAVANLARMVLEHDLTMVQISTDYVFDGTTSPHLETESLTPLGVYAQTKAAADIVVSTLPKYYIIRVSWLIGDGPNFVRTMMGLAAKNISPSVVSDQVGRLTFTDTLVDGIETLLSNAAASGTYNLSNSGDSASWADITRAIFGELGREDLNVTNVTTAQYYEGKPGIAPRPLQSTLELTKSAGVGIALIEWRNALKVYIASQKSA